MNDMEHALGLAARASYATSRKRRIPYRHHDDAAQQARLRVLETGPAFAERKGCFATIDWIRHEVGSWGDMLQFDESTPAPAPSEFEDPILLEQLARAVAALPERERDLVRRFWLAEEFQIEIGRSMGLSDSRVSQILKGALEELRRSMHVHETAVSKTIRLRGILQ